MICVFQRAWRRCVDGDGEKVAGFSAASRTVEIVIISSLSSS